jgi:hypothetical protein
VLKTAAQMPGADSLLVMESVPGGQTREYVQRVLANYWIYRLMQGLPSRTLDAAASAARQIQAVSTSPERDPSSQRRTVEAYGRRRCKLCRGLSDNGVPPVR